MVRLIRPISALLLTTGVAAAADLTPRDVWDDWIASFEDAEITTESVRDTGRNLSITGLSVISGTEETGRTEIQIENVNMESLPDGSVRVTTSPDYPVIMSGIDDDDVAQTTRLLVSHPGLEMIVSDKGEALQHSFDAPEIRVEIVEVLEDGVPSNMEGQILMAEVTGHYLVGEEEVVDSAMEVAKISAGLTETGLTDDAEFTISFAMNDFASTNLLYLMGPWLSDKEEEPDTQDTRRTAYTTGDAQFFISLTDETGDSFDTRVETGRSTTEVLMTPRGMSYNTATETTAVSTKSSMFAFPFQVGLEETSLDISAPLLADDAPQPFSVRFSMQGLTADDGIWNMFDPAAILPRDPGDLAFDLSGEMTVREDLDPASVSDQSLAEVETLSINNLRIALAGAEVLANGQLEFPNVLLMEPPAGRINVTLRGAAVLIERLSKTGIIPLDQAMAAGMMLSMLTNEGESEDERTSEIRFSENGSVFVNGQQLR